MELRGVKSLLGCFAVPDLRRRRAQRNPLCFFVKPGQFHLGKSIALFRSLNELSEGIGHTVVTLPFVLSWSMLEAMSAGCAVVGSRTAPVSEIIKDGENGLLVDFFSPTQIADAVDRVLDDPTRMQDLRYQARRTILEG